MDQILRLEESTAGMGFLGGGQRVPPHQLAGLGERCKLRLGNFGFWSILGPQKSRQNYGQLAFESGGNKQICPNVMVFPQKPLDGMRCHLAGTLVWSQVTLY